MIEIRKHPHPDENEEYPDDVYQLFCDGILLGEAYFWTFSEPGGVSVYDYETSSRLASLTFTDLPDSIGEWSLKIKLDWSELVDTVAIERAENSALLQLSFKVNFSFEDWKGLYSFAEYGNEFFLVVKNSDRSDVEVQPEEDDSLANGFFVRFPVTSKDLLISEEIERCIAILHELHNETDKSLIAKLHNDSIVLRVDFPAHVRVACEQYLLYFVQFLRDLGVEATSELKDEAGQALFSVTPTDPKQALDKIRAALEVYLNLASSPINTSVLSSEIEVHRLTANIQHLQGQLTLAHAVLQAKNAAIELQQTTIEQQRRILSGEIIMESIKEVTPKPEGKDKEELIKGAVSIIPIRGKGVEVNLPEIFRWLKRLFREE